MAPKRARSSPAAKSPQTGKKAKDQPTIQHALRRGRSLGEDLKRAAAAEPAPTAALVEHAAQSKALECAKALTAAESKELRAFDLCLTYGPTQGPTRQERWDRAMRMGLEPPSHVLVILAGRDGADDANASIWKHRI